MHSWLLQYNGLDFLSGSESTFGYSMRLGFSLALVCFGVLLFVRTRSWHLLQHNMGFLSLNFIAGFPAPPDLMVSVLHEAAQCGMYLQLWHQ